MITSRECPLFLLQRVYNDVAMSNLIAAVVLSKGKLQLVAVELDSNQTIEWKLCVEVVVPALVDPLLILEKHFAPLSNARFILVHQQEVLTLLQRRYARGVLVHADPPQLRSRELWSPWMPEDWAPLLSAHWRVADLIYAHRRRIGDASFFMQQSEESRCPPASVVDSLTALTPLRLSQPLQLEAEHTETTAVCPEPRSQVSGL